MALFYARPAPSNSAEYFEPLLAYRETGNKVSVALPIEGGWFLGTTSMGGPSNSELVLFISETVVKM